MRCGRPGAAVASEPDVEALRHVASLHRAVEEPGRAAQALLQAARLAYSAQRPALWLEAADLWESRERTPRPSRCSSVWPRRPRARWRPSELAERFHRLGAPARAVEVGFGPALESGDLTGALALAERAGDAARVREALWALVALPEADAAHVTDLATGLRAEGTGRGCCGWRTALAQWDVALATGLRDEVLRAEAASAEPRLRALESLAACRASPSACGACCLALAASPRPLAEALLNHVRELPLDERVEALADAADGWPERSGKLLRERFRLQRDAGRRRTRRTRWACSSCWRRTPRPARASTWSMATC